MTVMTTNIHAVVSQSLEEIQSDGYYMGSIWGRGGSSDPVEVGG